MTKFLTCINYEVLITWFTVTYISVLHFGGTVEYTNMNTNTNTHVSQLHVP